MTEITCPECGETFEVDTCSECNAYLWLPFRLTKDAEIIKALEVRAEAAEARLKAVESVVCDMEKNSWNGLSEFCFIYTQELRKALGVASQ